MRRTLGWCARFDLDIPGAVVDQLAEHIGRMTPAALEMAEDPETSNQIPAEPGIYCLHHAEPGSSESRVAYVGKAEPSLRARLARHAKEFRGRRGMALSSLSFVAVPLSPNWSAFGPENVLIKQLDAIWQHSGFGNNDTGRQRDGTKWKPTHFDVQFPIDDAWPIAPLRGEQSVAAVFRQMKEQAPFLFRYGNKGRAKAQLDSTKIEIAATSISFSDLLVRCLDLLPEWHGTLLPGYAVAYPGRYKYHGPCRVHRAGSNEWESVLIGETSSE